MKTSVRPMPITNPYLRLMRLHQPTGIWLVFWPCAWLLLLFNAPALIPLFFAGAVITRSAGCIVNDMADRELDRHVERTKSRPLASGELSLRHASALLALLVLLAAGLLGWLWHAYETVTLVRALFIALPTMALITAYPFMKRITWWPQAFLGITINLGVFFVGMVTGTLAHPATWWLFAACFFWTLGYDTIYGHMDKADDVKIGIKSTSRRLSANSRKWIGGFYAGMLVCMALGVYTANPDGFIPFLPALFFLLAHLSWQVLRLDADHPATCLRLFKSNVWMGFGLAFMLALAKI